MSTNATNPSAPSLDEVQQAALLFMASAQAEYAKYWQQMNFTHATCPVLKMTFGRRYASIHTHELRNGVLVQSSIYAFIDQVGGLVMGKVSMPGDIYKPASFKIPAKHARGNVFDARGGMGAVTQTAIRYL